MQGSVPERKYPKPGLDSNQTISISPYSHIGAAWESEDIGMLDSCSLRTGVWENLSLKGLLNSISPDCRVPHRCPLLLMPKCKILEKMKSVSVSNLSFVFCLYVKIQQVQYICSLDPQPVTALFCKSV